MPENKPNREDAAEDALIAYALGHFDPKNLSDEEILESSVSGPLSDEAREVLRKFKPKSTSPLHGQQQQQPQVAERELAGMYRSGSDETLDKPVKDEIERKRAELREKKKREQQGDV
jgi:hypothetical protein